MFIASEMHRRYPVMSPYVGDRYGDGSAPKLLVVAESHYLPPDSTAHHDPDRWYAGSVADLTDTECGWINTAACVRRSLDPQHRGSRIFRNVFTAINEAGPRFADPVQVADHIAYCNFFLRPGERTGGTIGLQPIDVRVANETFPHVLVSLQPDAILFVSRKAFWSFNPPDRTAPCTGWAPHPSRSWWNKPAAPYGGRPGRELVADFIRRIGWQGAPA